LLAAGRPIQFTITGDVNVPQRQAVRFWPASDTTYSVLFTYEANIIPPKYLQVSDGLASTTAGSATVTGSGTNWETAMAGTVIRFSRNATTYPTGTEGENPAFAEYIVDSVQSPTSLTLQENATDTQTSVKSSISSLLDIDWYTHRDYLFKEAYRQYRNMARVAAVSGEMMDWQRALTSARQLDSKYEGWQGSSPWRPVLSFYDVSPINLQ
jgi:hypothetical protein